MNERIKQLWDDAALASGDETTPWEGQVAFMALFAELIVKECIEIAQDRANFPGFPPNDVNDIIDEIREHFGVENSIDPAVAEAVAKEREACAMIIQENADRCSPGIVKDILRSNANAIRSRKLLD